MQFIFRIMDMKIEDLQTMKNRLSQFSQPNLITIIQFQMSLEMENLSKQNRKKLRWVICFT